MLTETGRVVAVDDDGLWVETVRRSTCNACRTHSSAHAQTTATAITT